MKMKDSGAGQYRPVKCSIFEQKHAWGHHGVCSHSQCQSPTVPGSSTSNCEPNTMGIRTLTKALQVRDADPISVTQEPSNHLPLKTIGALQEEILVLARTVRELEQIRKPDNEECESNSNGSTHFDNFRHYSRIYGHMVNMFMCQGWGPFQCGRSR